MRLAHEGDIYRGPKLYNEISRFSVQLNFYLLDNNKKQQQQQNSLVIKLT